MTDAAFGAGEFCWHELATRDRDAAKKFYAGLFGWTAEDHEMPGDMPGVYTMLRLDGKDVAGLFELAGPMFEGVPPHWSLYVATADADTAASAAKERGAELLMPPFDVPGVGRMATFKDPQGAVLSVFCAGEHRGSSRFPEQTPGTVVWNELVTPDPAAAKAFYTGVFGWSAEEMPKSMPGGHKYTLFKTADKAVAGMLPMFGDEWKGIPPHWMCYFGAADVDATAAKAGELGGDVKVPPTDIEQVGRFAVIADPTDAVFSIIRFAHEG